MTGPGRHIRKRLRDPVWRLPTADGSSGQGIVTDGAGQLSFATPAGGAPSGAAGGDLSGTYPNPGISSAVATAAGRALIDDADAAAQRTTLGLGGAAVLAVGTAAGTVAAGDDARLMVYVDQGSKFLRSPLGHSSTILTVSGTANWSYIGRTVVAITPRFVVFRVTSVGVGTQVAEVCFASTPVAPNGAAQTLTVLAAKSALDDLTSGTTTKRNTVAMATSIPAGTELWCGTRFAMSVTQPILGGLINDWIQGYVLTTTIAAAFAVSNTYTGSLLAITVIAPDAGGEL